MYDGRTEGSQSGPSNPCNNNYYDLIFVIYKLKALVAKGTWKQLSSFRSLNLQGGSTILRRVDTFAAFPKCCSQ